MWTSGGFKTLLLIHWEGLNCPTHWNVCRQIEKRALDWCLITSSPSVLRFCRFDVNWTFCIKQVESGQTEGWGGGCTLWRKKEHLICFKSSNPGKSQSSFEPRRSNKLAENWTSIFFPTKHQTRTGEGLQIKIYLSTLLIIARQSPRDNYSGMSPSKVCDICIITRYFTRYKEIKICVFS